MPRITIYEFFPIKEHVKETKDPTNVNRTRSQETLNFTEIYSGPMHNFLHDWATYFIGNSDNKIPVYNKLNAVAKLFRQRSK